MNVEVINTVEALEKFSPEWSELYRRCPRATPFQSPQWLLPWTRHFFRGRELWALAIRDGGELIGFAPLFCWGIHQRTVSFLGAGISDYCDLLYAPGMEAECVAAVWRWLTEQRDRWDLLDLQELRCGSGFLEAQPAVECSVCPVLDLSTYPEAMDHKHRTDLRRARNKLKHSELQFAVATETDFTRRFEEFFRLHEARWGPLDDSIRRFHGDVAAEFLAAGLLRLCLLHVDNEPAAAIYSFSTAHTLYCYLSGFDQAMAKLSPGGVLLGWLIERAIAEGTKEVDFLRQRETYKYLWGAKDRVNYKVACPSHGR
jgi:CelD/BcsL family acetyltransferase involved in cellulose biosynthesis